MLIHYTIQLSKRQLISNGSYGLWLKKEKNGNHILVQRCTIVQRSYLAKN
jgi:hypothetical protein